MRRWRDGTGGKRKKRHRHHLATFVADDRTSFLHRQEHTATGIKIPQFLRLRGIKSATLGTVFSCALGLQRALLDPAFPPRSSVAVRRRIGDSSRHFRPVIRGDICRKNTIMCNK
jgi:hypothetical protein